MQIWEPSLRPSRRPREIRDKILHIPLPFNRVNNGRAKGDAAGGGVENEDEEKGQNHDPCQKEWAD
jgi:hypothetical protein